MRWWMLLLVPAIAWADPPEGNVGASTADIAAGLQAAGVTALPAHVYPLSSTDGPAGQQRFKVILDADGNVIDRETRAGAYIVLIRVRGIPCGRRICVFSEMKVVNLRTRVITNSWTSRAGDEPDEAFDVPSSLTAVTRELNRAGTSGGIALAPPPPPPVE